MYFNPGPDAAYYLWVGPFYELSAAVILYYDCMLTLPREVQFLWPPHNNLGWFTLACFLNRYIPVIGVLPIVISYFVPVNPTLCKDLHTYHEGFMMTVQMLAGTLCLLRVYALYGQSRRILGLLLLLGIASIITALVSVLLIHNAGGGMISVASTFAGCAQYTLHRGGLFYAIAWTGLLVFDTVIFSLTLYEAFTIGRGVKMLNVIVRDGTMYFSILSLMNLGNIMTFLFAPPFLKTSISSYANILSTILVNRLVLNLRERAVKQPPSTVGRAGRFQVALPVSQQSLSMTSVPNPSVIQQSGSTGETVSVRTTTESRQRSNDAATYVPPLVEYPDGSFGHGEGITAPCQPHVRGDSDTLPSPTRQNVQLEPFSFFYATGRSSALFDPESGSDGSLTKFLYPDP